MAHPRGRSVRTLVYLRVLAVQRRARLRLPTSSQGGRRCIIWKRRSTCASADSTRAVDAWLHDSATIAESLYCSRVARQRWSAGQPCIWTKGHGHEHAHACAFHFHLHMSTTHLQMRAAPLRGCRHFEGHLCDGCTAAALEDADRLVLTHLQGSEAAQR